MSSASKKTSVEGILAEDGSVMCPCGKKCGQAVEGAVEFSCRCGNRVCVDSNILFLRNCEKGIETISKGMETIQNIISLMASKQRSVA